MNSRTVRKSVLYMAIGICLASWLPVQFAHAANTDGSLVGRSVAGAQITVRNPETGFSRTVIADADGKYRFPFLPVGDYAVQASKDGAAVGESAKVTISLGNATRVNFGGVATLGTVQVVGSGVITPVDVTSTESAVNITSEQLDRLPVPRDAVAVALLAPGVNKGDADSSALAGGISFGGSSVSENTVYVNGLNVTDFYNRIGFSTVPYSFFQEFQLKTGGYSVEFGRTTGGVINTVTKSGSNDFHYGADLVWDPSFLQTSGTDRYDSEGNKIYSVSRDESDSYNLNLYASGAIVKDRLFFYALYEIRDYTQNTTTSRSEDEFSKRNSGNDFWGVKLDWLLNDRHSLALLAFSDKNSSVDDVYSFDASTGTRGSLIDTAFSNSGGDNWALTYTGQLNDDLSMKVLYGETERQRSQFSNSDIECNRVTGSPTSSSGGSPNLGCNINSIVENGLDNREAFRADFEWSLGDHLLRFGMDHEVNTSDYERYYPGPGGFRYTISRTTPGTVLNGGVVPAGITAKVQTRRLEVDGIFETINSAFYIEDDWAVSPNLVLNGGLRVESFDNRNGEGDTYIKISNQIAPRFGFAWDVNGDQRAKLYGNVGRYFLPVANVINIKQGGGFLDQRIFYAFNGFEDHVLNGVPYQLPILGAQIGGVDVSQGDGTVGDLRGEVDDDMQQVYQDEYILGFQAMIDDKWSWGVRGIYRKLTNAIDDMGITYNGHCEMDEFVMGNPGEDLTFYTDTDCDGENDAFVTIDTSEEGWALYDDDGNFVGSRGWEKPKRNYKAVEFILDRAWDENWSLNASYTLAYSSGNAEGPVNSDIKGGFSDSGRTENFDDPFVNLNGDGPLANDRRHQFKFNGVYAFNEAWQVGATFSARSGQPISPYGAGNPFDGTEYFSRYLCVANCNTGVPSDRIYELAERGSGGRLPWTYDLGASVTYLHSFGSANLRVSLVAFNLFNVEHQTGIDEEFESEVGDHNDEFLYGTSWQAPRSAQLRVSLDF